MRNVFDQYSGPENRLTHAVMASLEADHRLLSEFIRWAGATKPKGKLTVLEQSLPGEPPMTSADEEYERRGLPDGWIYDSHDWSLLVESKVSAVASLDQIHRHIRTAERRGFVAPYVLWLTVMPVKAKLPRRVVNRTWMELYEWLIQRQSHSPWAKRAADYFEIAEVQADMKEQLHEGTLTTFAGIPFEGDRNPYSYVQAKRLLGLLWGELRKRPDLVRQLGMDAKCTGRGAITGTASRMVWDYLLLKSSRRGQVFTQNLHLTVGILDTRAEAFVTVPNGVRTDIRNALLGGDYEHFHRIIEQTTVALDRVLRRYPGAKPEIILVQRRYATQRSIPQHDADIHFDPRTAIVVKGRAGARSPILQSQWLIAAYDALKHRKSNLQFQIGAVFPYGKYSVTRTKKIIQAIAEVWIACGPVVKVLEQQPKKTAKKKRVNKVGR